MLFTPRMARSLVNVPLAMHDDEAMALRNSMSGREPGMARVRNLETIPEVDAQAALAKLHGLGGESSAGRRRPYQISTSGIALMRVQGDLVRTADIWDRIFGGVTSYEDISETVLFANEDSDCRAIFAQFNSGGGLVDGMVECADFIYQMSARNGGKPIYAYAADRAMSAAYLLFAACDKGFVGETGGVGSIGVKAVYLDHSGMLEQDGVTPTVFRSRPGKALADGLGPLPQEEVDRLQGQIDYLGGVFEKRVAKYISRLSQTAIAQMNALDYTGPSARAIGLVDEVLSMPEAWAKLERKIAR